MHRSLARLSFAAALALALAVSPLVLPSSDAPLAPTTALARVGGRPPPFTLPAATGGPTSQPFRMAEHLGRNPVVILFWATWCSPCRQELPFYQSLYRRYEAQGLKIVAISLDNQSTIMQAGPAARRLGVTFDVVTDLDTRVTTQLNPRRSAPFSIWVNRQGRITWEREGFAPSEQGAIARGVAELVGG
ncbi:MAG: TlpA family protein disulfide reductase [Sandaracinaceae bacterium]